MSRPQCLRKNGPCRRMRKNRDMEVEIKSEGSAKTLNAAVAVTVVIISTFMAVSKVKDDNIWPEFVCFGDSLLTV